MEGCKVSSEIPFLRSICLILSYKCQLACAHCIINAGSEREEETSLEDAFRWIESASKYRDGYIKMLSLTGGEPFYDLSRLRAISSFAEDRGFLVSAVTNSLWASTQEKAVETLRSLPSIKMISVSTDIYHQKFVPLDRTVNAIMAAKDCGISYNIHICTTSEENEDYQETVNRLKDIGISDGVLTTITFPIGRASQLFKWKEYKLSANPPVWACTSSSAPLIYPDGKVVACCGALVGLGTDHPLVLGNLRDRSFEDILDHAETNSILHAIRIWGPHELISLIKGAGLNKHLPEAYIDGSICYACYMLFSNQEVINFLNQLSRDPEFKRKVAYARAFYLNETQMIG